MLQLNNFIVRLKGFCRATRCKALYLLRQFLSVRSILLWYVLKHTTAYRRSRVSLRYGLVQINVFCFINLPQYNRTLSGTMDKARNLQQLLRFSVTKYHGDGDLFLPFQ